MITFRSVKDKALDVDPDLRFMALEDFKKLLDKNHSPQIEEFVPVLFKLLEDQNPDVKSQTTKLFPAILPFISTSCIRETVLSLFDQVRGNKGNSVAMMVLKLIFNSNFPFSNTICRTFIEILVPQLTKTTRNDFIELLVEIIKNFTKNLKHEEFLKLSNYLLILSFDNVSNSIGKKSIYALDLLISRGPQIDNEIFNSFLSMIDSKFDLYDNLFKYVYHKLELLLTLIKNNREIDMITVEGLFNQIKLYLNKEPEDLDYDQILEDNLIKEVSLDILIYLLPFKIMVSDIIDKFIDYNPISSEDSESDLELDDEIDFSDDEMDNEVEDFDDGSWKLRLKALVIISNLNDMSYIPRLIGKIGDKNDFIFKQSISTLNSLLDDTCQNDVADIETKIMENLNNENLTTLLSLIESVISNNLSFSDAFIQDFIQFLQNNMKNFELVEVLNIINILVENISGDLLQSLGDSLIPILCGLLDKNSNIVFMDLKILNQLIIKLDKIVTKPIFGMFIDKLNDTKLLIDLKIELLNSINIYALNNQIEETDVLKIIEIYKQNSSSELMIKPNLINLNQIFSPDSNPNYQMFLNDEEFQSLLINSFKRFLSSNTSQKLIFYLILQLFNKLDYSLATNELIQLGIAHNSDIKIVNLIFDNFSTVEFNDTSLSHLVKFVGSIENSDMIDLINIDLFIDGLCERGNYYDKLESLLDLSKLLSIKILASISVKLELFDKIDNLQLKLNQMIESKKFTKDFIQILQYLSFINLKYTLTDISLPSLIELLQSGADDSVKFEISKSLGYLTKSLPQLLTENFYNSDDSLKVTLLNSIKYYLRNYDEKDFEDKISKLLSDEVNVSSIKKEFKLIGEILSIISIKNDNFDEIFTILNLPDQSIGLIYTNLIVVNHLTVNLPDRPEVVGRFIPLSYKFFDIVDIEIKIILVKNFINLYYNYPDLLNHSMDDMLPKLLLELKLYEEFKKIIPMGPYKYVIDQGLEIRKLIFELLYSIINDDRISKDLTYITDEIVEKGLADKEFDVINLSYTNLLKLLHQNPEYLTHHDKFDNIIDKLSVNLNKKLKSKATSQEIEIYQESLKNLINLLNKINDFMVKYNWSYGKWDVYYNAVKKIGDL